MDLEDRMFVDSNDGENDAHARSPRPVRDM